MADKKICPLTYSVGKGGYDQEIADFDYCVEGKCMWWDDFTGHCAILSISRHGGKGSFQVAQDERKE